MRHILKPLAIAAILTLTQLIPHAHAEQTFDFDPEPYLGEHWYGMYMNGAKIGYSVSNVTVADDGRIHSNEKATFKLNMVGIKQKMTFSSERIYGSDGALNEITSSSDDISGKNHFHAIIQGEELTLTSTVGGQKTVKTLPKPAETLQDMESVVALIANDPEIGDSVAFSFFEPMFAKEIEGTITILGQEEKVFGGVLTQVYKTKSTLPAMGLTGIGYMTKDGQTLEESFAGIITMRLEAKEIAQDVNYANDTIISNAALIKKPIKKARTRESVTLRITGPFTDDLLLNDERQSYTPDEDYDPGNATDKAYTFTGKKLSLKGHNAPHIPITESSVQEWLKPSLLVQSDNPKLIEKAQEIIGDKTNAIDVSDALCHWVYKNMEPTFSARLTNSLEVLDSMEGDCTEHSMLFIGLARAAGLPAREVAGLIYAPGPKPGFYFHQWARVWVGKWIEVDPTFNQPIADATHIRLVEGDLLQQSRLLPVIGKLKIEVID